MKPPTSIGPELDEHRLSLIAVEALRADRMGERVNATRLRRMWHELRARLMAAEKVEPSKSNGRGTEGC